MEGLARGETGKNPLSPARSPASIKAAVYTTSSAGVEISRLGLRCLHRQTMTMMTIICRLDIQQESARNREEFISECSPVPQLRYRSHQWPAGLDSRCLGVRLGGRSYAVPKRILLTGEHTADAGHQAPTPSPPCLSGKATAKNIRPFFDISTSLATTAPGSVSYERAFIGPMPFTVGLEWPPSFPMKSWCWRFGCIPAWR